MKKIFQLKEEQKKLAEKIKETKDKARGNVELEPGDYPSTYQYQLLGLKHEYRHKHIAYCLLRGRKYEEIERTCRDDHKPDFGYIDRIKESYAEAIHENVCVSA